MDTGCLTYRHFHAGRVSLARMIHARIVVAPRPRWRKAPADWWPQRAVDRRWRMIRRLLTPAAGDPIQYLLETGPVADEARQNAALAGVPELWQHTVWGGPTVTVCEWPTHVQHSLDDASADALRAYAAAKRLPVVTAAERLIVAGLRAHARASTAARARAARMTAEERSAAARRASLAAARRRRATDESERA